MLHLWNELPIPYPPSYQQHQCTQHWKHEKKSEEGGIRPGDSPGKYLCHFSVSMLSTDCPEME